MIVMREIVYTFARGVNYLAAFADRPREEKDLHSLVSEINRALEKKNIFMC